MKPAQGKTMLLVKKKVNTGVLQLNLLTLQHWSGLEIIKHMSHLDCVMSHIFHLKMDALITTFLCKITALEFLHFLLPSMKQDTDVQQKDQVWHTFPTKNLWKHLLRY